ncbi:hypothetical protein Holit_02371 [Hollandina sp. SP2]
MLSLNALRVNIRDGVAVVKKSVYVALVLGLDGQKERGETTFRSGCGIEQNEEHRTFGSRSGWGV